MRLLTALGLLVFLTPFTSNAQSDGCSFATLISVTTDCTVPATGTTSGATETIPGCTGTADDDVWYQFVATSAAHQIVVNPSAGMDPVVQLFENDCATLTSLVCKDGGLTGIDETINYNGLTIGLTYRVRVYDYYVGSGTGNFSICITTPPPAPSNDNCANSTPLNVNSACSYTSATTDGASQSLVGCSGSADDDVWFSFVATNSLQNIHVNPIDNLDVVFQVYSGTCASLSSIACIDQTFTAQDEQSDIVGLIPGQTYFVRVYDYNQGNTGDFGVAYFNNSIVFASKAQNTGFLNPTYGWDDAYFLNVMQSNFNTDSSLQKPQLLKHNFISRAHDGPVSFNADGTKMIITKNKLGKKNGKEVIVLALYFSNLVKGEWSELKPFEFNNDSYNVGHAVFNEDESKIYFASDKPGGFGESDLYVSEKYGQSWLNQKTWVA